MAEFYGLTEDDILSRIENGETLTSIAQSVERNKSMLSRWLNADEQRSVRARGARTLAAAAWDELAEDGIRHAPDQFALAKAKEVAYHLRWRASKIAPKEYGDKVETVLSGEVGISRIERVIKNAAD